MWKCYDSIDACFLFLCCGHDDGDFLNDSESLEEQDISTFRQTKNASIVAQNSESQYASIQPENAEEDIPLGSEYDPDEDYVMNYEKLGWHGATTVSDGEGFSLSGLEKMATQIDEALTSNIIEGNTTPRSVINTSFQQYNTCISATKDLEKKRDFIKRYELLKFEFDEDNEEDKDRAELYLSNARNTVIKTRVRLEHYQIAIKFTNNVVVKQKLKEEYRRYAFSVSGRETTTK